MKKWIKNLFMSVLLVTVFSATTASAKNIATAVLEKAEDSNDVSVAIDFSESRTEEITSLRFKLLVAVEETGDVEFSEDSVSFEFADIPGETKDAAVAYDSDVTDYIVDIILSGKSNLFQGTEGPLVLGTLRLPDGNYRAEIGCAAADESEDSASELQYVESAGMQTMTSQLKTAEPVYLSGKTPEPSPVPQETEPQETEPQEPESQKPESQETESQKVPEETPVPSAPAETEAPSETKPALKPAEPSKNGLAAPKLTVKPVTGTKTISFSWKKVKGAQGYQIFKYDEKTGKYKSYKLVKGTSCTAKFSFGKTYRFKVRAYKKKNGSKVYGAFSAEKEVTASSFNKQKKPSLRVSIPDKGRKFQFTWKKLQGADGYQVLRYLSWKKKYKVVKTVSSGDTLECLAVKYKYAADYRFRLRAFAFDENGKKVYGAESAVISIATPPAQVKGVKAKAQKNSAIRISWEKLSGADGYFIYRSGPDKEGAMKRIAKVGSGVRSYVDEGLDAGASYYYQVAAFRSTSAGKKTGKKSAVSSAKAK